MLLIIYHAQKIDELCKNNKWIVPVCLHSHWFCVVSYVTIKKTLKLETSFQQVVDAQKHEIYSLDSLGLHCPSSCNTVRYMKLL